MSGTNGRLNVELSASGVAQVESEFGRLETKLGTLAGAQRKYESDVALVQRTMERNPALMQRGTQALDALHSGFQKSTASVGAFSGAMGEVGSGLSSFAGRMGPAGTMLSAFGPAGIAAAAGMAVLGGGLAVVAKAGDDMVSSLGRIRAATGSVESAAAVYDQLYRISVQTGQSVSDSASQFQRFSIATKEVGATNAQAVKLVETLQKAAIVGGASSQEASSAALQLGQALASGVLQGEELRSLLENMPNLAVALAQQLGVGVGELRKMGSEGKLTAETILPALLRAGEAINGEYEKMPVTMARAFDQLNVSSSNFLARLDQALGLSQRLAGALAAAARGLDAASGYVTGDPAAARSASEAATVSRLRNQLSGLDGQIASASAEVGSNADRDPVVAGLRQQRSQVVALLDEQTAAYRAAEQDRLAILRDARELASAETADAAQKRLENQSTANTKAAATLRTSLDKDLATRQAWQKRVDDINALVGKPGGVTEAEGQRLVTLATKERDEALKKLQGTQEKVRNTELEGISAIIREQGKAQEQYEEQQNRIFDNAQKTIEGNAEQLRILQTESSLLGSNADLRDRELAIMRERKRITGEQIKDEQQIATLLEQAGKLWDQNRALEQQKNSFEELSRVGERAFDRIGTAITSAFADGSLKALDFGNIAKAVISEVVQSALRLAVINPALNSLFGGTRGTIGGLGGFGASAQSGGAAAAGPSLMDMGGGLYKLGGSLLGSSKGPTMLQGGINTGWGYLDGGLNSTAYSVGSGAEGLNVTYGGAAAGALGVAGGAYGIYSGIQNGGAKGWAQGIGGAASIAAGGATLLGAGAATGLGTAAVAATTTAAGVAGLGGAAAGTGAAAAGLGAAGGAIAAIGAVAPYIAVAALIASYFLSGQKPSDMTGTAMFNLDSGDQTEGGLGGKRFSQDNRDAATQMGAGLRDIAGTLRTAMGVDKTPIAYEIAYGNRDGIKATFGGQTQEYERDQAGADQLTKDVTQAFIQSMRSAASTEVQAIVDHSGADTGKTLENLDWYRSVYEPLKTAMDAGGAATDVFGAQMEELRKSFAEATTKASDLGLATSVVTAEFERQRDVALASRNQEIVDIEQGLRERTRTATGMPGSVSVLMSEFEEAAESQSKALRARLETLGAPVEWINNVLSLFASTVDAEREANLRQATANDILGSRSGHNQLVTNWQRVAGLTSRYETASSEGGQASLGAATAVFDAAAAKERSETFEALVREGLNGTAVMFQIMADLEKASGAERVKLISDYADRAKAVQQQALQEEQQSRLNGLQALKAQSEVLTGWLDQQAVSGAGVSPEESFRAAQQQYGDALASARSGGDLQIYSTAASTLLDASNSYLGTGLEAATLRQQVLSTTRNLGADLNLPGFSADLEAGLTRVITLFGDKVSGSTASLEAEVARLADELRSTRLRA